MQWELRMDLQLKKSRSITGQISIKEEKETVKLVCIPRLRIIIFKYTYLCFLYRNLLRIQVTLDQYTIRYYKMKTINQFNLLNFKHAW